MSDAKAAHDLTYAFGALLRFNGILLHRLVRNGALTLKEAEALISDLADHVPDTNMLHELTEQLRNEFHK